MEKARPQPKTIAKDELKHEPAVPPWFTARAVPFLPGAYTPLVTNVNPHVAAYSDSLRSRGIGLSVRPRRPIRRPAFLPAPTVPGSLLARWRLLSVSSV